VLAGQAQLAVAALVVMVLILFFLLLHLLAAVVVAHNHDQGQLVVLAVVVVFLVALALRVHQGREMLVVMTAACTLAAEAEERAQLVELVVQQAQIRVDLEA